MTIPAQLQTVKWIEMAVFASSGMTSSYQGLNLAANYSIYAGNGFQYPIKGLKIYNGSSQGITVSYDGITPNDYWPSGATIIIDLQTNHADFSSYGSGTLNGREGQIIYGKGTAGTGSIYISGFY